MAAPAFVMPGSTVPTKTALGLDELRHRTRRLGQRHRTVLLLVDGQRLLSEVLSLAQQAGAATSHFEELVNLGLVELPAPIKPPDADIELPIVADEPEDTSVELIVLEDQVVEPIAAEAAPAPAVELVEPPPVEAAWERTVVLRGPAPVPVAAAPAEAPIEAPIEASADTPPAAPPERRRRPRLPAKLPVLSDVDEGAMLQQVRELLVDTLRLDAPLFGARTFLQVRAAQGTSELIDLVWEIERHLSHARHSRSELLSLQRARELLGLGNTLVADDNDPGFPYR